MIDFFEHHLTVGGDVIDEQGHTNNVAYLGWLQEAAIGHSTFNGWGPMRYLEAGFGFVARSHYIEYLQPTFAGDQLTVRTWVATMTRVTSDRRYQIVRRDDPSVVVVRAETRWAFVKYETLQPIRIPPQVSESFILVDEKA